MQQIQQESLCDKGKKVGGADRDRTGDLYNAIVALSQLSYGPTRWDGRYSTNTPDFVNALMEAGAGIEPTSKDLQSSV